MTPHTTLTKYLAMLLIFGGATSLAFAQEVPDPASLSESTGDSTDLSTATYRENVYVLWKDDTLKQDEIFFRASHDNGKTFDDPINISRTKGDSINPKLVSQDSHVYVFWMEPQESDSKLVLRTSNNFGRTFADPIILADKITKGKQNSFSVAAWNNNLYVMWMEFGEKSSIPKMILRSSADHGKTFSDKADLLDGKKIDTIEINYPQIVISENNLYASWTGFDLQGKNGVFFAKITNDSMSEISKISPDGEDYYLDHIVASKNKIYVLMQKHVWAKSSALFSKNEEVLMFSNNTGLSFVNPVNLTKNLKADSQTFREAEIFPTDDNIYVRLASLEDKTTQKGHLYLYAISKNLTKFHSSNFTENLFSDGSVSKQLLLPVGNTVFVAYEGGSSQHELAIASENNGILQKITVLSDRLSGQYSYEPKLTSSLDDMLQVTWVDLSRGKNMQYNRDIFFAANATENTNIVNLSSKMPKQAEYFAIDKLDVNYFDTDDSEDDPIPIPRPTPKPAPEPRQEPIPEPYFEPKSNTVESLIPSPLQQLKSGIPNHEIKCKGDLVLLQRLSDNLVVCVSLDTSVSMIERNLGQYLYSSGAPHLGKGVLELINYEVSNGVVDEIIPDLASKSIIVEISPAGDGELSISLPRMFIDARLGPDGNNEDDSFFVLVNGAEVDFEEKHPSKAYRHLVIPFSADSVEIEIIGTSPI